MTDEVKVTKKLNNDNAVNDKKGSIEAGRKSNQQGTNILSLPTAASEANFKDESQEEPSDDKTTEISRGQESLPTSDSAVCKDRLTPTTDHLEKL